MPKKSSPIAARLRALRAANGLSQKEVAESIGRSQTTLCTWEKYGCVGLYDAVKLADFYGVTLDEIAGRTPLSI